MECHPPKIGNTGGVTGFGWGRERPLEYIWSESSFMSHLLQCFWNQSSSDGTHSVSSVHLLSCVRLFVTPWTAARQASLSITNSWTLVKPMSIESVMPSNHLTLCPPLLLKPSIFPGNRVFESGGQSIGVSA